MRPRGVLETLTLYMYMRCRRGCLNLSQCAQATLILCSTSWHEASLFHMSHAGVSVCMYASPQMSGLCRGLVRSPWPLQMNVMNAGKMERHARQSPRRRRRWYYKQRLRPQGRRSSAGAWAPLCARTRQWGCRARLQQLDSSRVHSSHQPIHKPTPPSTHTYTHTHTHTCTHVHISVT